MKIKTDKLLHFFGGIILALLGYIFVPTTVGVLVPPIVGGIVKEMYDWVAKTFFGKPHTPEWQDMVATWAGGIVVLVLSLFF